VSWQQATLVVSADQVEAVSAMLEGFLAQAVTTENAGLDEFYEVAFPGTPDWQHVRVTGLFDQAINLDPIIEFISKQVSSENGAEIPVSVDRLIDQDWERVWLNAFKPIKVGTNLWVTPSWCDPVEPSARNINLDPGLAFGTGTHATTQLCLRWLADQDLREQRVLDYGSGTGILAIAAIMSGAAHADAVDIDPLAVNACKENAARNNCAHKLNAYLPSELERLNIEPQSYNLVIANILASVVIELKDTLLHNLVPGGTLLLTGLLATQVDQVADAYGESFDFVKCFDDEYLLNEDLRNEASDNKCYDSKWCLLIGNNPISNKPWS